ncbi:sigma 54 modulation/S30EA ribosomal C-terminal domain-containing protein [Streptacidiphilus jiangxiensis]|uniref:Sigma 54 modulation/S30EA ribosomal protein C terminus n=1 Tax=Streptacidiphilus jiangxiensis TaxID=235985 RepID=A0A1H7QV19_STRJI|nr:sigma 54 modulation/S30EA ribosomal C-terminal domain-containing protein [Streptacidiphilus jiangxiensis]SEL51840.1 Sigma 54 modulation/S30EA ribosomal protein C terminus [Streptacidiphilus jiangxiensis]
MDHDDLPQELPELQVTVLGEVSPATSELARSTLAEVLAESGGHIRTAQVRLARMRRQEGRPATAQALVDVDGQFVRAQVAAHTMTEAIALLRERLTVQLTRLEWARHWDPGYDVEGSGPLEWREGTEGAHRPVRVMLPKEERGIVRRKAYDLVTQTVDRAALTMEMMDYDFHLFTEFGSGQDSVVYRFGPGPFRLAQLDPQPERVTASAIPVNLLKTPAPVLTEDEAKARLGETEYPFVFFKDASTGRGTVLYWRYDGHYGLVSAAAAAGAAQDAARTAASEVAEPTPLPAAQRRPDSLGERVEALEGRVAALADALDTLTTGLESGPGEPADPEEVRRAARLARELLIAAGFRR